VRAATCLFKTCINLSSRNDILEAVGIVFLEQPGTGVVDWPAAE